MGLKLRVKFPGLLHERNRNGSDRWRVRVEGNKSKRITLNVSPDHKRFSEHYSAARAGVQLPPEPEDAPTIPNTVAWLVQGYQAALDASGLAEQTVATRKRHTDLLRASYGEYHADVPTHKLIEMRDMMQDTPSAANGFIKTMRVMFTWALERGKASQNPARDIVPLTEQKKGAVPWSVADLQKYRKAHPSGTPGHLLLTVLMFTACRIEDAVHIGRQNEFKKDGQLWLKWQPTKKGSPLVRIPMAPQLVSATRAATVVGPSYILNAYGKPFASKDALGNRFRKDCDKAGLEDRSAHGVRKAAGYLMAEAGLSQYAIMTIHGHTEAKTSEVYTRGVDRDRLAAEAMAELQKLPW